MKNIIAIFIIFIISFSYTNASNLENKLYKGVVITKLQIAKDYKSGKEINEKIVKLFIKYRYLKDIETLTKLEKILKIKLENFNSKPSLSISEKKTKNLYTNLYYRTQLLLKYNIK